MRSVNEDELLRFGAGRHGDAMSVVAGTIAPIEASKLRNLGGAAEVAGEIAAVRVIAAVPGVGSVELDATSGQPTLATLARAKAVAARLLADPSVFRVAPEAGALLGPGVLDMAALAAVVASLGGPSS